MFGGKVKDMFMGRITQAGASLDTALQRLGGKRGITPRCDQAAEFQAPVRIEIIDHPVVALHSGELLDDVGQMRGEVLTSARLAQIPDDLTGGDDKRGNQGPHAMPDVLVLAFFWLARGHGLCRVFALQNLHAGLFIAANDHTALLKEAEGVEV